MSLLDSVIGALGAQQPGGGQADLLHAVIGMLGHNSSAGGAGLGGLAGLVDKFQQAGLGNIVNSWVSTGANQSISPDQLGGVLGNDAVAGFARQLGIHPQDALGQLAHMLPQVVDKLTPNGQVPQGEQGGLGDLAGMLGGLLGPR